MIVNRIAYWRSTKLNGKGVSQAHLARQVKVGRSFITKLEKGKAQPSAHLVFEIAKYFGQPVEQIFQPDGHEFPPVPLSQLSSCLSSGNRVVTDKSLPFATAKVVACLSRSKPNTK